MSSQFIHNVYSNAAKRQFYSQTNRLHHQNLLGWGSEITGNVTK